MVIEQRIDIKSDFVEEKDVQQTVSKVNSDRKIELSSNSYALSTLPIAKGRKKIFCIQTNIRMNTLMSISTNILMNISTNINIFKFDSK